MQQAYPGVAMKRKVAILVAVVAYIFGLATPYVAWYGVGILGYLWSGGGKEVSRRTSPDGVLDAVVIEDDPGAMSSFIYYLYLVPRGTKISYFKSDPYIVNTSEGDELSADWQKPHFLEVNPGNGHVKCFANLWYSKRVPNYYVELKLTTPPGKDYLQRDGRLRGSN
jgi:hypothetical protein